jgi:peptidyl-prolyl cis-trans isomerase D
MLDVFRNKGLSTIVYGVVIVGMVLVFVIQFNPSAGKKSASLNETCVATVKGWCIGPKDLQASFRLLAPRDREMTTQQTTQLRKIALDGLVERELLTHEADRLGITVSDGEVTDNIFDGILHVSLPSDDPSKTSGLGGADGRRFANFRDSKTKIFDNKIYERTIKNLVGRSPAEFREEQAREILAAKVRDLVRTPVRVSEDEASERYIAEKSQAQIEQWVFKNAYFARWIAPTTDAALAAFTDNAANKAQADALVEERKKDSLPVANHLRQILAKVGSKADDKEKAIALSKISLAAARLKAGEAFGDVARELSDDKASGLRGGDLGDKSDPLPADLQPVANALKPGEVTHEAYESALGYHLLERDDPAASADVEAKLHKDALIELETKERAPAAAKAAATRFIAELKAGKSADDALSELAASLDKAHPAPALLTLHPMPPEPSAADAGAESTAATDAGAAKPSPNATAKKPPTAPTNAKPAPQAADSYFDALTDPDRPSTETSSSFNKTGDAFPSLSPQASQKVNQFAFTAKENDITAEPMESDEAFVVLRVKQQKPATKEEFDKDRPQYMASLLALKQAEALATYTKRLLDASRADIKIDDSILHPKTPDGGVPADEDEEAP